MALKIPNNTPTFKRIAQVYVGKFRSRSIGDLYFTNHEMIFVSCEHLRPKGLGLDGKALLLLIAGLVFRAILYLLFVQILLILVSFNVIDTSICIFLIVVSGVTMAIYAVRLIWRDDKISDSMKYERLMIDNGNVYLSKAMMEHQASFLMLYNDIKNIKVIRLIESILLRWGDFRYLWKAKIDKNHGDSITIYFQNESDLKRFSTYCRTHELLIQQGIEWL